MRGAAAAALTAAALGGSVPVAAQGAPAASDSAIAIVAAARGYDRQGTLDSARLGYEAAAVALPSVADWLRLRAAGVTADSATRAADYALVHLSEARTRIDWTDAQARDRTGDIIGAMRVYATLGATASVFRTTAELASAAADSAVYAGLRARLFAFLIAHPGAADARPAIQLADRVFTPLTRPEELAVARSAASIGPLARSALAYDRLSDSALPPADLLSYGVVLLRLRREDTAARVLADLALGRLAGAPPALVHVAQYDRARALLATGDTASGRTALGDLVRAAPHDTASAHALFALADLAANAGDDRSARATLTTLARQFPTSALAPAARFQAALIAFVGGRYATAAAEWDGLARERSESTEVTAATYWSARAWVRAGDVAAARERWRRILRRDPLSYYAMLSARRLSMATSLPPFRRDTSNAALPAALDSVLDRAATLRSLGMEVEAEWEVAEAARRAAAARPTAAFTAGMALIRLGAAGRAVTLARALLNRGGPKADSIRHDIRLYRLLYPVCYRDTLRAAASVARLDPALVAAVIRQESACNPAAVSISGARGLMQIMPAIGADLARAHGFGPRASDPAILDQPAINLPLGTAHLATFLGFEHGDTVRGLAAYNAGPRRVTGWAVRRGTADDEVFTERIPVAETRDYVRAIIRGREVYAAVYGADLSSGP